MPACPRTHFEFVSAVRPRFLAGITELAATIPAGSLALTATEIEKVSGLDRKVQLLRTDMVEMGRINLPMMGYRDVERWDDDDVIRTIPSDVRERWPLKFSLEHTVFTNFIQHGRQVYHFSSGLTDRLADTEMNVDVELTTLPHPSVLFVYDSVAVREAMAAITQEPVPDTATVNVYANMMMEGEHLSIAMFMLWIDGDVVGNAISRSIKLEPGGTVEQALRTNWVEENGGRRSYLEEALPEEHFYTVGLPMVRIVVNSALYLASSNPDIVPGIREALGDLRGTSSKERRKMQRELERRTILEYTAVGRGYRPYDRDGSRSGLKIESRVKVQGHWKMQAHGPGMSLRKIINVEPYWRGPDMAEAVSKPHVVR